jgi:ABC-type transporter Mla subunit MlaD
VDPPLTAEALAATSGRLGHQLAELTRISEQLADRRGAIEQLGRDLETANAEFRAQVDGPTGRITLKLSVAEQRLNDLAVLLGAAPAPARTGGGLADDAEWARQL